MAIFVGLFAIEVAIFLLQPGLFTLGVLAVLTFLPKTMITAWNHHHQHVPTFRSSVLNMMLEVIYGFQTGVLPEGWVLHHNLGHHPNFTKGTDDESAWVRPSGRVMGEAEYTLRVGLMAYPLIFRNMSRFPARHGRRFLIGLVLSGLTFGSFLWIDPIGAVILFLLPAIGALFGTVWHTYKHHAGLKSPNPHAACWNMLDPFYNRLTGNLGYHTAHHISCGTHWSKLPALHAKIAEHIPEHLYRAPGFPFPLLRRVAALFRLEGKSQSLGENVALGFQNNNDR